MAKTKTSSSSSIEVSSRKPNQEDKEAEQLQAEKEAEPTKNDDAEPSEEIDFMKWFEETEEGNILDFDNIPAFNVPFAELIRTATKSPKEFTEVLRTEAHIYSYDKFVARLGGTPAHIFNAFGLTLIKKYHLPFLYSWMLA
jgi:hypothetical protein